ncbi:unnamed protein product [Symbiodinium necroappetens]|uniref:Endonuclease/exonuclease/phosphatase domain-containing protein n=1 Tax=Symbiodinium necroappetens TaxID=1628268 RepID=A0A812UA65_9DINO|nr:unnamed protein product [Symbiodinium necroappetens]
MKSRGGGGLFFLRSQKRDHEELGRGGGFNERQTATDLKVDHNSDDELYDEFGRKKRRKAKAAAKGPSKTEAPKAEDSKKAEEVPETQKQKEPGSTPPAAPEPSPTAASAASPARVIDPRPGKGAQKGPGAPGAPGFPMTFPAGGPPAPQAQQAQAQPNAWPGAPFGKGAACAAIAQTTPCPYFIGVPGGPRQLRVVAYNVCGFGAGFGDVDEAMVTEVYGKLREDLQGLKADIICLNEVRPGGVAGREMPGGGGAFAFFDQVKRLRLKDPEGSFREDSLEALAEDLEEMEFFFAHANPGYETFGNAILIGKRLQVLHCDSLHLEGGSVITLGPGKTKHIGRGCLSEASMQLTEIRYTFLRSLTISNGQLVCVEVQGKQFATLVTHWDHISEAERLRQAESILSGHSLLSHDLPHLLVGDLNAMKRSDYTDQEWAGLEERNALKGWAPPENSQALLALEREGYRDLGDSLHQRSRWTKKEGPGPPIRIDYIYASKHFSDVGSSKLCPDLFTPGSDHLPLVADILLT